MQRPKVKKTPRRKKTNKETETNALPSRAEVRVSPSWVRCIVGLTSTAYKANYMNSDSLATELSKPRKTRRESGSVFLQLSRQDQLNPRRYRLRFSSQMVTAFAQYSERGSVLSWRNCTFCQSADLLDPMRFDLYSGKNRLNHRNRLDHTFTKSSLTFSM